MQNQIAGLHIEGECAESVPAPPDARVGYPDVDLVDWPDLVRGNLPGRLDS